MAMTFDQALPMLREGKELRRETWGEGERTLIMFQSMNQSIEMLQLRRAGNVYSSWNPTHEDIIGRDWVEVTDAPEDEPSEE